MPRSVPRASMLCLLLGLAACGADKEIVVPARGEAFAGSVESGGRTRTYQVWVPRTVTPAEAVPVIVAFHGAGSNAAELRTVAGLDAVAEPLEMLVVYPNAAANDWAEGCGCSNAESQGIDDVQFLRDLLDDLALDYTYDPERVFLAGLSQGGLFAQHAACEAPERVAAVAVVASSTSRAVAESCALQEPMPMLLIHGTQDPVIPFTGTTSGSRPVLGALQAVAHWLSVNGCSNQPTETITIDRVEDGTEVVRRQYADCEGEGEVVFFEVKGGGHTWPNSRYAFSSTLGRTSRDFEAADDIGLFFDRH